MISYMPLDSQSIFTNNNKHKNCYNLAKNIRIEILPNSTYIYKHGFYFNNNEQKYYIQIDDSLSDKLVLQSNDSLDNLNNEDIHLYNLTSELLILESYQPIINLSSNKFKLKSEPVVEQVAEPVVESVVEPVVESVAESVVESVAESVVEPVAEPVVEPVAEPVVEPVSEPVVEPVSEPVVEPVAEPVVEPVVQSVSEPKRKYIRKKKQ